MLGDRLDLSVIALLKPYIVLNASLVRLFALTILASFIDPLYALIELVTGFCNLFTVFLNLMRVDVSLVKIMIEFIL